MNPWLIAGAGAVVLWLLNQQSQQQARQEAARRAAASQAAADGDGGGGSAEEWIQKGGQYVGLAATVVGIGAKVAGWLGLTGTATATTGATVAGSAAAEAAAISAAEAAAFGAAETSALVATEAGALFAAETAAVVPASGVLAGAGAETAFVATETVAVAGAETGAVAGTAIAETAFIGTVASGTLVLAGVGAVVIAIMVSEMLEQQRVMRQRMRRLGDAHDFTGRIMQPFIDAKTYDDVKAGFSQWSGSDGIQVGNALSMFASHRHNNDFLPWNLTWAPKYGAIHDTMTKLGYPGQALITVRDVNSVYEASADDRIPAWESMMSYLDQIFAKFEPSYPSLVAAQQQPPLMVYQLVKEPEIISGVGANRLAQQFGRPELSGALYQLIPMMYTSTVNDLRQQAENLYNIQGGNVGGPIDLGSASP